MRTDDELTDPSDTLDLPAPVEQQRATSPRRHRRVLILFLAVLTVASGMGAGYWIGRSSGEDLDAARTAGSRAGAASGRTEGEEAGRSEGEKAGYEQSFQDAYDAAFKKALEDAGVP